jgi:hypothetical protein
VLSLTKLSLFEVALADVDVGVFVDVVAGEGVVAGVTVIKI